MAAIKMVARHLDLVTVSVEGPTHDELWAEFCATVEERIDAFRQDVAPACCPTCGTTVRRSIVRPRRARRPDPETKRCPKCTETLPRLAFTRKKANHDGLAQWCRACSRASWN